jgi:hypothetical protein
VPLEGVVDALRRIHSALAPGGLLVDTQPLSPHPPVSAGGVGLGALDMRDWCETVAAVDRLFDRVTDSLYAVEAERRFLVTDTFDSGIEFVDSVGGWRGTHVPAALRARTASATPPRTVDQEVRLRLLRAIPLADLG